MKTEELQKEFIQLVKFLLVYNKSTYDTETGKPVITKAIEDANCIIDNAKKVVGYIQEEEPSHPKDYTIFKDFLLRIFEQKFEGNRHLSSQEFRRYYYNMESYPDAVKSLGLIGFRLHAINSGLLKKPSTQSYDLIAE